MPQTTTKPAADSIADLYTHVLHNHRIPSSQHAPTSVTKPASSEHLTSGVTTNRLKPWWSVEPPKGWEEHMFGLRDRRHSLTPLASSIGASHLPSPSMHQQGQIHNENTMTDIVQESMDNEDRFRSNNKEGSEEGSKGSTEGSDYTENKESSSDCKALDIVLLEGGDTCTPNARPAPGVHSPLPPSSLPADWTDDSGPDAESPDIPETSKEGKSDHEMTPPYSKKLGNLSKVVLEEIQAFVRDVKMIAQELGQWHGWSTHDILVTAGFGIKPSHTKINEVHLFHSWYWATQPKPAGSMAFLSYHFSDLLSISVNRDTLNNLITKEYNALMQDIPKDDPAVRREKLQAVYDPPLPESTVQRCNSLDWYIVAEAWSNLEDIKIVGVVMTSNFWYIWRF
ncbi:hypothetical protein EV401DRAFT_1883759 [Pisolithus croceorrhizus]|nr:hypothetical protein EV401DRAFT_1883759 [Pisolithus croceorrhizus]